MEHLLNDDQRAAYQAFALNHSHHGGWRPLHLDGCTPCSSCSTCHAGFRLPAPTSDAQPGILVVPDSLLEGMTLEQAEALLGDSSSAFEAGVRWAVDESTHGELRRPTLGGRVEGTGAWVLDELPRPDGFALSEEGVKYRPALRDPDGGCWTSWLNMVELDGLRAQLEAGAEAIARQRRVEAPSEALSVVEPEPSGTYSVRTSAALRSISFVLAPTGEILTWWTECGEGGSRFHAKLTRIADGTVTVTAEPVEPAEAAEARTSRHLLGALTKAISLSNLAITPEVRSIHDEAVRYLLGVPMPADAPGDDDPEAESEACPECPSYNTERKMLPDSWACLDCGHTFTGTAAPEPTPIANDAEAGKCRTDQAQADLEDGISLQVNVVLEAMRVALPAFDMAGAWSGIAASRLVRELLGLGWDIVPAEGRFAAEVKPEPDVDDGLADSGPELAEAYVEARRDPVEALGYARVESIRLATQAMAAGAAVVDVVAGAREIDAYRDSPLQPGAFLPLDVLEQLTAHLQGQAQDVTHEAHEALVVARAHARRAADAGRDKTERF